MFCCVQLIFVFESQCRWAKQPQKGRENFHLGMNAFICGAHSSQNFKLSDAIFYLTTLKWAKLALTRFNSAQILGWTKDLQTNDFCLSMWMLSVCAPSGCREKVKQLAHCAGRLCCHVGAVAFGIDLNSQEYKPNTPTLKANRLH